MRPIVVAVVAALAAWLASPARAQVVTGRVVVEGAARAAHGAWVILSDSTGTDRAGVLADSAGRFTARAPVAGRFTVRAQLIGHQTAVLGPYELVPGSVVDVLLSLREQALPLDAIAVEAERRCAPRPDAGAAAAVWDEVRKVLSAVQWTGRQALVTYRLRQYERTTDLRGRTVRNEENTLVRRAERPFTTPPPDSLAVNGFVQERGGTSRFYAPDAEVLLSDAFVGSHCFRVQRGRGAQAGLVGLTFEPASAGLPDVFGTLWLDETTSALRWLEYRYTGIDYGPRTRDMGGRLDFARLPSGAWIIEKWWIRGPALEVRRSRFNPRGSLALAGFIVAGGEVVEVLGDASDAPRSHGNERKAPRRAGDTLDGAQQEWSC